MRKRSWLLLAGVILLAGPIPALAASATGMAATPDASTLRRTTNGDVVGSLGGDGVQLWQGLPYAAPPVGPLRWRAPRPASGWKGVRQALAPGSACIQASMTTGAPFGQEDCLYLNVWAPPGTRMSDQLPVMVWIHGGGNVFGQGADYPADRIAATQHVIVVTINYRLGMFGWFANPALRETAATPEDRSGNFGTLDIIAALKWVKANVAGFGGDPGRVTIFGESAGGCNVYALLTSPLAKGLFQRAISESGYAYTSTIARAENLADAAEPGTPRSSGEVLLRLLINEHLAADRKAALDYIARQGPDAIAAYLRTKSFAEFSRAQADIPDTDMTMPFALGGPQLFRDGVVLPKEGAYTAFRHGRFNRVPVILGTNRDEYSTFLTWYKVSFVKPSASGMPTVTDVPRFYLTSEYASKMWKARDVDGVADAMNSRGQREVFAYRFDWSELPPNPALNGISLGATHGLDLSFVFGSLNLNVQVPVIQGPTVQSYRTLSDAMMSYWSAFAVDGDPGRGRKGALPRWRRWGEGVRGGSTMMILDSARHGGIRMSASHLTKADILRQIAVDPRMATLKDRCILLRDMLAIRGAAVTAEDFDRFGDGSCPRLAPPPPS